MLLLQLEQQVLIFLLAAAQRGNNQGQPRQVTANFLDQVKTFLRHKARHNADNRRINRRAFQAELA